MNSRYCVILLTGLLHFASELSEAEDRILNTCSLPGVDREFILNTEVFSFANAKAHCEEVLGGSLANIESSELQTNLGELDDEGLFSLLWVNSVLDVFSNEPDTCTRYLFLCFLFALGVQEHALCLPA